MAESIKNKQLTGNLVKNCSHEGVYIITREIIAVVSFDEFGSIPEQLIHVGST